MQVHSQCTKYIHSDQPSPLLISQTFSSCQPESLHLLYNNSLFPPPIGPANLYYSFCLCKAAMKYLSHCVWPISLSIVFSWFIHVAVCIRIPSLLWLNNIPLYVHTVFSLSIHLLMDIWLISTFWL